MTRLLVDIAALARETGTSLALRDIVEAESLSVGPEEFVFIEPIACFLTLSNTGAGLVLSGTVSASVRAQCVRCLQPFEMSLEGIVEGLYVLEGHEDGMPEEQEYEIVTAAEIDVWPTVESALAVAVPFAPLHDEDCAGICPTCGVDRNEDECSCAPQRADSPFAMLEGFFDEDGNSGEAG